MNLFAPHKGNPAMRKGAPSVNPAGRPLGSRQKIAEALLADLADVWKRRGAEMLERLADDEPSKLTQIAFGLLPRDVFVQVKHEPPPGNLTVDEFQQLRSVLDAVANAGLGGVPASEIFSGIESYLRSEYAKPVTLIEHQPDAIPSMVGNSDQAGAVPPPCPC
jgi:hypothetical protein